jgi:hypothetical protein
MSLGAVGRRPERGFKPFDSAQPGLAEWPEDRRFGRQMQTRVTTSERPRPILELESTTIY